MSIIVLFVIVAVIWLAIRASTLSDRQDGLERQVTQLSQRLARLNNELQSAKLANPAPMETVVSAGPLPAVIPPPPAVAEPVLEPLPLEVTAPPPPVPLEALPIAPVAVEPLAEAPAASVKPITPPPLPPAAVLATLARANAPVETPVAPAATPERELGAVASTTPPSPRQRLRRSRRSRSSCGWAPTGSCAWAW